MSFTKRISRKGHLLAFSALLLVAALAFVIAPVSSQAAGGALRAEAGQNAADGRNRPNPSFALRPEITPSPK